VSKPFVLLEVSYWWWDGEDDVCAPRGVADRRGGAFGERGHGVPPGYQPVAPGTAAPNVAKPASQLETSSPAQPSPYPYPRHSVT
jgi:hypothetical protein